MSIKKITERKMFEKVWYETTYSYSLEASDLRPIAYRVWKECARQKDVEIDALNNKIAFMYKAIHEFIDFAEPLSNDEKCIDLLSNIKQAGITNEKSI